MYLSNLKPNKGSVKKSKRVARGNGNGSGKTACRGENGANSRSGAKHRAWFEGGQMPLQRRLPKRGFYNKFSQDVNIINLQDIQNKIGDEKVVDIDFFVKNKLVKKADLPVKVLAKGDLESAVTVKAASFSKAAIKKIEDKGGKAQTI